MSAVKQAVFLQNIYKKNETPSKNVIIRTVGSGNNILSFWPTTKTNQQKRRITATIRTKKTIIGQPTVSSLFPIYKIKLLSTESK